MYQQGFAYHIKDSYFEIAKDPNLMTNKENGGYRPTYYCIDHIHTRSGNPVPVHSNVQKILRKNARQVLQISRKDPLIVFSDIRRLEGLMIRELLRKETQRQVAAGREE